MGARGPKADKRPPLAFKVEQSVYDVLAGLQEGTGMTPDQSASLLLHILVLDPPNAVERLKALLGSHVPEEPETRALLRDIS